jgi:hypothetical protein
LFSHSGNSGQVRETDECADQPINLSGKVNVILEIPPDKAY